MNAKSLLRLIMLTGLLPAILSAAEVPGGISISPVRVDLFAEQHAAAITVSNAGSEEKMIQVEPMLWSHPLGEDQYEMSRELVVNPPLFRLPPGGSQVVRVGLARKVRADATLEKNFRIYFQELPQGAAAEESQLRILLRLGVPVFVKPLQAGTANLRWQLTRDNAGKLILQVRNTGTLHERVTNLRLNELKAGSAPIEIAGFSYVLPGDKRQWEIALPDGVLPAILQLHAVTEGGAIHAELPLPGQ